MNYVLLSLCSFEKPAYVRMVYVISSTTREPGSSDKSIPLRLLPAESVFTAVRNAHLLHQGFDCRARQAGHFTHVELAVFLLGSTKCKSIATVRIYMCSAANPGE